jgi:hypothetical protein
VEEGRDAWVDDLYEGAVANKFCGNSTFTKGQRNDTAYLPGKQTQALCLSCIFDCHCGVVDVGIGRVVGHCCVGSRRKKKGKERVMFPF